MSIEETMGSKRPIEERVCHPTGGPEMTKQSMAPAADINVIMDRWLKQGVIPVTRGTPQYGDFTGVADFHDCQNRLIAAERDFMELPAFVRRAASNDVGVFLEMLQTEEGREALKAEGLVEERIPERAQEPAAGNPEPAPSEPPE